LFKTFFILRASNQWQKTFHKTALKQSSKNVKVVTEKGGAYKS